jgi:hypothetical protein
MQPTRTEINQANSQHSTGPKSEHGKKKSSLNALSHGLTAQAAVLPSEDQHAYRRHVNSFIDEYHPKGATESHLVQSLADVSWRLNRVASIETNLFNSADLDTKALANLSMHSQRLSRQFERTVVQLHNLQKTRRAQEKQDLDQVLDIIEMHKAKGETYRPSSDGFVFSEPQINSAAHARIRERLASEAREHRTRSAAA